MTARLKAAATAVALAFAPVSAGAATLLDFTVESPSLTGSVGFGGITYAITGNPQAPNANQSFDGPSGAAYCGAALLACKKDGFGVSDDEITAVDNSGPTPNQSITVTFSSAVNFLGFHALDLFRAADGDTRERAVVYRDGRRSTTSGFGALETIGGGNGGYRFAEVFMGGVTSLTFFARNGNDDVGNPDWALAGVVVQAVPLPAAAWMLLAGLAGLGIVGRKRAAA